MLRISIAFVLIIVAAPGAPASPPPAMAFRDVAKEWGVDFRFENGSRGKHDLPEIMAGGLAVADFDGDGRVDLYLCDGGPIGDRGPARGPDPPCRLFLNRLPGPFVDVTAMAGAPGPSYAMGAATGDFDGDGRVDLLVTGWCGQRLYRNLGGGRFEDRTAEAGLESSLWSTSAAFADLDGDGDLDLYVANYLDYDPELAPFCAAPDGRRDYCGPEDFPAQADRLYRNNGDGTFSDVSKAAGIDLPEGRGLGVLIAELTGDNRPDIFVANDGTECWLFANRGGLRFAEIGATAGVARDGQGKALAGMGIAVGDLEGDGMSDLAVTNFFGRSTVGFRRLEAMPGIFADASSLFGLASSTRDVLGFGIALADFDGDGRLDLIQANGHVLDRARLGTPFAMTPTLLRGTSDRIRLAAPPVPAGDWFNRRILGRGLAVGDFDGDRRPDVAVAVLDGNAAVLRNASGGGHFAALDLIDRSGHPAAGARVRATIDGRVLVRDVVAGGSYLSASPPRVFLGFERGDRIDRLEVDWPWGARQVWSNLPAADHIRIQEGMPAVDATTVPRPGSSPE